LPPSRIANLGTLRSFPDSARPLGNFRLRLVVAHWHSLADQHGRYHRGAKS
jgi:hypothetical protein